MSEVTITKQRVHPEKVDRLREWMAEIRDREDEARATLRNEGMYTEAAFLEHTDDGPYLVYFMEAADIDRAFAAFEDSEHEIDREHRDVLDEVLVDWDDVGEYEPLYHMVNPDRPTGEDPGE